jgi:ABC-2 type transport system permease protein
VLFIYGFSLLPLGLFNLVSINLYRFAERYIAEGNLDRVLLRPVAPLAQVLFESFNVSGLNELWLGTGIMIYAGLNLGLSFGPLDVLVMLVLVPSAALVYLGVFLGITCVSFWHEDRMGLAPPVYNVIRFARYPLTIYGRGVQAFLLFVLPFAWVAFMPATWFVGDTGHARWALLTPVVAAVVAFGALRLWRAGLRRYESTGN